MTTPLSWDDHAAPAMRGSRRRHHGDVTTTVRSVRASLICPPAVQRGDHHTISAFQNLEMQEWLPKEQLEAIYKV